MVYAFRHQLVCATHVVESR
jgi:hypothetical protein